MQVMSLVSDSDAKGTPEEVTGPGDPLKVAIAHVLHLEEGTLSLRIAVGNRLSAEMKNIVVRCVCASHGTDAEPQGSGSNAERCWV